MFESIKAAVTARQACSIALGIIGALIMGTGMSLCMTDLSGFLGGTAMFIGIPVGIVGMVLVALAYPLYNRVLKKQREKSHRRSCVCRMNC